MSFSEELRESTECERKELLEIPLVARALEGRISLPTYIAFLSQAYHHVKHTIPLLVATGAALPDRYGWLCAATVEYIREETGHDEWILADLAACGVDPEDVRGSEPDRACEVMVAYAYDVARRRNSVGFFGMVYALEDTSSKAATPVARASDRARASGRSVHLPDEPRRARSETR